MSDSVWPHGRQPIRGPRPWDSPGKNTGVGCHFLLQSFYIYMISYDICLSLTSLSVIISRSIHVAANGIIALSFDDWMVFHCKYVLRLFYPSLRWWACMLLPRLDCSKYCCCKRFSACIFSNYIFVQMYVQDWACGSYGNSTFSFSWNCHNVLHSDCVNLHSHRECKSVPFLPHSIIYCLQIWGWWPFWLVWGDSSLYFSFAFLW